VSQTLTDRPELAAARLMLERMGISPGDLLDVQPVRPSAPTFAEYVPVVAAAVSPGARRCTARTGTGSCRRGASAPCHRTLSSMSQGVRSEMA
jgi:hypothetical protein